MKYFKNTELARIYNVSEKSIRNWIDAAQAGRLNLQLQEANGKKYVANTIKNTTLVEALAQKGKKYKNSRSYKTVKPTKKFYDLYSQKQIFDIISNIDIYREIPLQYCYFNSGATHWDQYVQNLSKEHTPNPLTNTVQLLKLNLPYLDNILKGHSRVNIIDLGVGNAQPVRSVLEHFAQKGQLGRYIGIDISQHMLDIAGQNIRTWFGDTVAFEGHVKDFNYDRFDDLLVNDSFGPAGTSTVNIVLFLGGTINNLREPDHALAAIHDSLGKQDLFLFSKKLDTEKSRRHFDVATPGNLATTLVLDLLNIDPSYYEVEQLFDEHKMAREVRVRLNIALSISFEMNGKTRAIELNKGDTILLWRARHQTALETIQQFDGNGFELLQAAKSRDNEYLLMTSKLKAEPQ